MKKIISILMIITMLTLFASCKAEKEALSLTGETKLAPANKNEPVVADAPIEEPKTEASTTDEKTSEQTTNKEIDEIVSRVIDELKKTTEAIAEATTKPESKTSPLSFSSNIGDKVLTITSVKLNYEYDRIEFSYTLTGDLQNPIMPVINNTKLIGNSGKTYTCTGIGGARNTGTIEFSPIGNFSDLSTVTLTYQFEGFDPVTVTFNIPV